MVCCEAITDSKRARMDTRHCLEINEMLSPTGIKGRKRSSSPFLSSDLQVLYLHGSSY